MKNSRNTNSIVVIIPARYASTRLPGKPLLDIAGKPLVQRVHDCAQASGIEQIVVATDDARIAEAVSAFGGRVCMTSGEHQSGTDRIAECIEQLRIPPETIVVNLQGDEPLMPPALIAGVATALREHPQAQMATGCHLIEDYETLQDPNVVKVVRDAQGFSLYFSRAAIPWPRDLKAGEAVRAWRHIGLYAYRAGFVARFAAWPPCPLERTELLEQLRVLWHGERIFVHETEQAPGPGVDTPADLLRLRAHFEQAERV